MKVSNDINFEIDSYEVFSDADKSPFAQTERKITCVSQMILSKTEASKQLFILGSGGAEVYVEGDNKGNFRGGFRIRHDW